MQRCLTRCSRGALILLLTALFLGFLHGLGPDHLMAIAALSLGSDAHGSTRRARAPRRSCLPPA